MRFCYFLDIQSRRSCIGRRTQPDWTADATRLGGGRNLIGWRTQPDRTADGI